MIDLTTEQIERLIALKDATRQSYADLAESQLGDRTLAVTLRSTLRKYKRISLPAPVPRLLSNVIQTRNTNALVIADLHAPYQNSELLQIAIDLALVAGIREVDIAGDIHDFNSLSPLSKGEPTTATETDIQHSRQVLTVLTHHFERVHVVSGNHDEYWIKKRGGTFEDLIYNEVLQGKYRDQVYASDYDYMLRGEQWVIGHLSSYDDEAGKLAAKIADLMDRNVLVGHDHLFGYKISEKGYIGASVGAMLTPDRFWYKQRRLNTFPPFMLGFSLILEDKLYMFNDRGNGAYNGKPKSFDYWKKYFRSQ